FESEADASSRQNQQILPVDEVGENKDAIESPNFGKISEFESENKVSSRQNQENLKVSENLPLPPLSPSSTPNLERRTLLGIPPGLLHDSR
ncbi:MAG: hypothetical protein HC941_21075, partial [Microcoleus sp. SU_5_3]|nr:hypothetical protein [Microcoleus sp. SU_5_3]